MEAEESAALAARIAKGERPFYYYCDDKTKPIIFYQVFVNNAGEVVWLGRPSSRKQRGLTIADSHLGN